MKAISQIREATPESVSMAMGLTMRSILNLVKPGIADFNTPLDGYSQEETREIGEMLNDILLEKIRSNPNY